MRVLSHAMKILGISIAIFASQACFAYYNPGMPTGFVNDYTQTLSSDQVVSIDMQLAQFEQETHHEISVVIIPSLEGDYIENFSLKLFEEWGIGKSQGENGVLLLIAKEDREMRIEVGYGLEGVLTDAQSNHIIQTILIPAFQRENFYGGIQQSVDIIMQITRGEEYEFTDTNSEVDWVGIGIFVLTFGGSILAWFASILARSKSWWAGGFVGGVIGLIVGFIGGSSMGIATASSLVPIGLLLDYIVSKNYKKSMRPGGSGKPPWWTGGGGIGARRNGGGFGGFGGGMSGGGGASGKW